MNNSKSSGLVFKISMFVILIVGLAIIYFVKKIKNPSQSPMSQTQTVTQSTPKAISESDTVDHSNFLTVAPEKMHDAYLKQFALKPDQRLQQSLLEIDHILIGEISNATLTNQAVDSGFEVWVNKDLAGSVSQYPDFQEYYNLLLQRIAKLSASHPFTNTSLATTDDLAKIDAQIATLRPHELFSALKHIETLWTSKSFDPKLVQRAAKIVTLLNLIQYDRMDLDVVLSSRAMALLAFAESLGENVAVDKALLASLLHYSNNALDYSSAMPENDLLKLYILRKFPQITAKVGKESNALERFLMLKALIQVDDEKGFWQAWEKLPSGEQFSLATFGVMSGVSTHAVRRQIYYQMSGVMAFELSVDTVSAEDDVDVQSYFRIRSQEEFDQFILKGQSAFAKHVKEMSVSEEAFRNKLQRGFLNLDLNQKTEFWDGAIRADFYKKSFLGALDYHSHFLLDTLSSVPDANEFERQLKDLHLAFILDFKTWYSHVLKVKNGLGVPGDERQDINLTAIGANIKVTSINNHKNNMEYGSPSLFSMIQDFVKTIDSRPLHRGMMQSLATSVLYDIRLTHDLSQSLCADSALYSSLCEANHLVYMQDREGILKMLRSSAVEADVKVALLKYLKPGALLSRDELLGFWKELALKNATDAGVTLSVVYGLNKLEANEEEEEVIRKWFATPHVAYGLENVIMINHMIELLLAKSKIASLQTFVDIIGDSQQEGSIIARARVYEEKSEYENAKLVFASARERYPDSFVSLMAQVQFFWRQSDFDGAAKLLKDWKHKVDETKMRSLLGKPLVALYKSDQPRALAVLNSLSAQNADSKFLIAIADQASKSQDYDLSFLIFSKLKAQAQGEEILNRIAAFRSLSRAKGSEQALIWAKEKLQPFWHGMLVAMLYNENAYSLMWELDEMGSKVGYYDAIQLTRLAALKQNPVELQKYEASLKEYYQGLTQPSHYDQIGLYLFDMAPMESLYKLMKDKKSICEVSYYIGLKLKSEKRYAEANDWFRISVETGQRRDGEFRWSYNQLLKWAGQGSFLAEDTTRYY